MERSRLLILVITMTVVAFNQIAAAAKRIDGDQLYEQCKSLRNGVPSQYYAGTCSGYIIGVIDSHNGAAGTEKMPEPYFCVPEGVTRGQLIEIVTTFLEEYAHLRNYGGATLIWLALVREFPCED